MSYGFNSDDREITGVNDRKRLAPAALPLSFTEQDIADTSNAGHNFSPRGLPPGDKNALALLLNMRGASDDSLSAYTELDGGRTLLSQYNRVRDAERQLVVDYTLALKRTIEPQATRSRPSSA